MKGEGRRQKKSATRSPKTEVRIESLLAVARGEEPAESDDAGARLAMVAPVAGAHVVHAGYHGEDIGAAIATQLAHGRYEPSHIYYRDNASETIAELLATTPLYTQKRFFER